MTVYAQLGRGRTTSPLISKEDEDPLGISDEGNRAKSEDEMLKMFPDGKLKHANLFAQPLHSMDIYLDKSIPYPLKKDLAL